jgi:hypothetical protein
MSFNIGNVKIKIEVLLRSVSLFYAMCFGYFVLRNLAESHIYGYVETSALFTNWKYGGFVVKFFFTIGAMFIPITLIYTLAYGVRHKANLKVVITAVLLAILLLELFVFSHG